MKTPLLCAAILAMTATGVHAGNPQTFHGSTALAESNEPMGADHSWIVPMLAIVMIAAAVSSDDEEVLTTKPKCLGGGETC